MLRHERNSTSCMNVIRWHSQQQSLLCHHFLGVGWWLDRNRNVFWPGPVHVHCHTILRNTYVFSMLYRIRLKQNMKHKKSTREKAHILQNTDHFQSSIILTTNYSLLHAPVISRTYVVVVCLTITFQAKQKEVKKKMCAKKKSVMNVKKKINNTLQ